MKSSSFIYLAIAGAMTLASCSNNEEAGNAADSRQLQVVAGISAPQTRAFDNQWNAGDEIGIYTVKQGTSDIAGAENLAYRSTLKDGTSTESNFAPTGKAANLPDDGSRVDVVSYYPYSASVSGGVLTLDIKSQDNQAAIDLLGARDEGVNVDNPTAVLNFKHKLTKIFMRAKTEDGSSLSDLKAYIKGLYTNITYDVLADKVALAGGAAKNEVEMRSADGDGFRYVEAIVVPNTVEGNAPAARNIEFEHNGMVYKAAIAADVSFEPGKKYVYDVTFTATGAKIEGAGITDWVEVPGDDVVVVPGGEAQYHFNNIYIFGSATPNGWNIGEAVKFTKISDYEYTASVTLKEGEMKFPLNNDWGCDWIMPTENGAPLNHTACMVVKDGDPRDYKWNISADEAGTYTIDLNVKDMTMSATHAE